MHSGGHFIASSQSKISSVALQ